jgi:hypothetical protein
MVANRTAKSTAVIPYITVFFFISLCNFSTTLRIGYARILSYFLVRFVQKLEQRISRVLGATLGGLHTRI